MVFRIGEKYGREKCPTRILIRTSHGTVKNRRGLRNAKRSAFTRLSLFILVSVKVENLEFSLKICSLENVKKNALFPPVFLRIFAK